MTAAMLKRRRSGLDSYMKLVRKFPLRPLRSESEYDEAVAMLEKLAVRDEKSLDAGERDYLAVLTNLVGDYDDEHFEVAPDERPIKEKLGSLMSDAGISKAEFARGLGVSHALVSLILSGRRRLSLEMVRKLSTRFRLSADYFM